MKNEKGFTLIELLAVIVIMGILMAIAIPSINLIIMDARKDIYVNSAKTFINEAEKEVINSTFEIDDPDTTYYIHIANLVDDATNLGKSGFATWSDSYVVATMNLVNNKVNTNYYFNSSDMAKWKITLVGRDSLKKSDVYQDTNKKVKFMPVGNRRKIVIYDKNGVKITDEEPYIMLDEEKAKNCYTYKSLSDTTLAITDYRAFCGSDVIIPNAIGDKEVVTLATQSFRNKGLTSIYIPNGIQYIDYGTFAMNKLTSVTVPSSVVKIDRAAFVHNELLSIKLFKTLQRIADEAFRYNSLTSSIEDMVPNPDTIIGLCAFCNNKISSENAFMYKRNSDGTSDYSTVVGYMGNWAEFSDKTFIIPSVKKGVTLKTIADRAFYGIRNLKDWNVVIPNTVTSIGESVFSYIGINSVNLPNGLKTIGSYAFYGNNLKTLNIPSSVTSIGIVAFNSNKVTSGDILVYNRTSSGIDYTTVIGYSGAETDSFEVPALKNGVKLKLISNQALQGLVVRGILKLPIGVTFVNANVFNNVSVSKVDNGDGKLTEGFIYERDNNGNLDKNTLFRYVGNIKENVLIPSYVKEISKLAFTGTAVKSVTIPDGVTKIGDNAFTFCDLVDVEIPSSVTSIGSNAFFKNVSQNTKLTKIVNKTGKSFVWKNIVGGTNSDKFETGVVKNTFGDITITKE